MPHVWPGDEIGTVSSGIYYGGGIEKSKIKRGEGLPFDGIPASHRNQDSLPFRRSAEQRLAAYLRDNST